MRNQKKNKKRKKKKMNPDALNQESACKQSSSRVLAEALANTSTEASSSNNVAKILSARPLKEQLSVDLRDPDSSEDEGIADYKVGGYHPVHVG